MKKIFIVFMVILLLGLTIVPSFAAYSASVEVVDNDTDTGSVDVNLHSLNYFDIDSFTDTTYCVNNGDGTIYVGRYASFAGRFGAVFPNISIGDLVYITSYVTNSSETFAPSFTFISSFGVVYSSTLVEVTEDVYNSTFTLYPRSSASGTETSGYVYLACSYIRLSSVTVDTFSYFDYSLSLSEFVDTQSELYTPLNDLYFSQDGLNNRGVYLQAFSDSDLTTDITSDVSTSSGLTVDSDGLIYLVFEDGVTDQLYYDGTVYYQVTLDPSPPYMFVNLYRHIFENFAGTYTFLTEDNWIFITCVSSIAICFVIFVGVFFFKRFSH